MTAKIISGREVAEHILEKELSVKVKELKEKNIVPNLVVILVGEMKISKPVRTIPVGTQIIYSRNTSNCKGSKIGSKFIVHIHR